MWTMYLWVASPTERAGLSTFPARRARAPCLCIGTTCDAASCAASANTTWPRPTACVHQRPRKRRPSHNLALARSRRTVAGESPFTVATSDSAEAGAIPKLHDIVLALIQPSEIIECFVQCKNVEVKTT
jgi:hypothetical protein